MRRVKGLSKGKKKRKTHGHKQQYGDCQREGRWERVRGSSELSWAWSSQESLCCVPASCFLCCDSLACCAHPRDSLFVCLASLALRPRPGLRVYHADTALLSVPAAGQFMAPGTHSLHICRKSSTHSLAYDTTFCSYPHKYLISEDFPCSWHSEYERKYFPSGLELYVPTKLCSLRVQNNIRIRNPHFTCQLILPWLPWGPQD